MLELRNIVKSYENKPLLQGVSFSVSKGETVCLLGASGSGKSTLLRIIAGLEFPESGHVLFNKIDLAQTPPHIRDFGLVFQDYGLFPHLNIFDNIAFGLRMRKVSLVKINSRVTEMLELVNMQGFEKRKVTDLSGGEQQRVALARALAPQPRLLMFDEPLGALDRTLKEDLLHELRSILHKTKIPAIYVTHDQDEAFTIADRILLLHNGEIIRDGTPDEVWKNPDSVYAARMLGLGNVIDGVVISANKAKTEVGILSLNCKHRHAKGEPVSLLLKQSDDGIDEIKLKVEDVLFKRDQFEIKARSGLVIHMKDAPKIGQIIRVRVKVECLA
ncbi:MAG: ABC transporter ATP-binding protein [Anaerolineales bacterium]|nr:ABC transporter ATP-binding protein [Anaerolineales bacterium]